MFFFVLKRRHKIQVTIALNVICYTYIFIPIPNIKNETYNALLNYKTTTGIQSLLLIVWFSILLNIQVLCIIKRKMPIF